MPDRDLNKHIYQLSLLTKVTQESSWIVIYFVKLTAQKAADLVQFLNLIEDSPHAC